MTISIFARFNFYHQAEKINQIKMKKFVSLFIIAAIIASCKTSGPQFVIKGKIAGAENITFILQERVAGRNIKLDSAFAKKGEFTLKGVVEYPKTVVLIAKEKGKAMSFYLENSEIEITGHIDSLNNAKVTGSKAQVEDSAYQASLKPFDDRNKKLYEEYKAAETEGDKAKMNELEKGSEQIYNEEIAFNKEYIRNHTGSFIVPGILNSISYDLDVNEMESLINGLDTNVAKNQIINDLKARVTKMKALTIGHKAPDFILNDVNGKPIALSSKIGNSKLLLIDFWAAWCGPCRTENPNVVRIYKEFNKKGFDVFGVSLDSEKEDWVKAIAEDKLTWTQVSDLLRSNSAAAKLYAVSSIPSNFLLDETGTIIAKNLRGENLYSKVKEVLGGK
jgi:peroxiredoxin